MRGGIQLAGCEDLDCLELGLLIRDTALARSVASHFQGLIHLTHYAHRVAVSTQRLLRTTDHEATVR